MEKVKPKKNRKKRLLLTVGILVLVVFLVVLPVTAVALYNGVFSERYETPAWVAFSPEDFPGLEMEECSFPSDDGQILAGYRYFKEGQEVKGVMVIAHGLGGGGQNHYMPVADYFTSNGYLVFAYDVTGNDKSEGESVKGLPQGIIDMDYALRYVESQSVYEDLPVVLFGHSWGGYSVGNVLNVHPEVEAVVVVAGFNRSIDLIRQQGANIAGAAVNLLAPYVSLYERIRFGEAGWYTAVDGFENTDAGVMILHSEDDSEVPIEMGYDQFYAAFSENSRFTFLRFTNRGHSYIYNSKEALVYIDQLNADYITYVEANGGEYNAQIKQEFMDAYLDKRQAFAVDTELMAQILEFFDAYCCG